MRKRNTKTTIAEIIMVIVCVILAWVILSESRSQIIFTICVLLLGAWVLLKGLEVSGVAELISAMGIPFAPALIKLLAKSPFAAHAAWFYNFVITCICDAMGITTDPQIDHETSITITFWILFALLVFSYSHMDHTAMKKRRGHEEEEFRKKNFAEKSKMFCTHLRQRLESINRETDWNENLFTPIEAEVEINIKGKKRRKFQDLLKSLKSIRHPGTIFLVLGEPGSGKSVSLRKLCLDLLQESQRTKKIPVYINLKKWNKDWNLNCLPTKNDLLEFIKDTLHDKGYFSSDDFVDTYFDKMFEDGRWYFIFDSFDEMPCLMGKQNCQELIDKISELLCQFMTGDSQSGGIIASRLYKSPSEAIGATVILKIQEFSDIKIKTMLQKYLNNAKAVSNELFGKRENLVALCRNPFYLTLLINYIRDKGLHFPENQMELYHNFVEGRLKKCSGKLESENITAGEVHNAAKNLAVFMQDSTDYGLEYPTATLFQGRDAQYWRKATRMLEYAKICRFGGSEETVTFVHRRFQEFFLVENIIENGQNIAYEHYESIVRNSGMRDALVLYCEVAEEEKAKEIAGFCWKTIKNNFIHTGNICEKGCMELVNTLYFMAESFRSRKSAIAEFEKELESLIEDNLNKNTDFVVLLAFANSMVLFDQKYLQKIVLKVFQLRNCWLGDIIMKNCRVIRQLDARIESQFFIYFFQVDIRTFWTRFRDVHFSLSLSRSFRYVKNIHMIIFLTEAACITSFILTLIFLIIPASSFHINDAQILKEAIQIFMQDKTITSSNPCVYNCWISMFLLSTLGISVKEKKAHFNYFSLIVILSLATTTLIVSPIGFIWNTILTFPLCMLILILIIHNRKRLLKWKKLRNLLNIDTLIPLVITVGIVVLIGALIFFLFSIEIISVILVCICALGIMIYVVIKGMTLTVHFFQDKLWLRRQLILNTIEREDLAQNLKKIHLQRYRRIYIETLLQNRVSLTGQWPDGARPKSVDNRLELNLAKLDCVSLDSCNYLFRI